MKRITAAVVVGMLFLAGLVMVVSAQQGDVLARVQPLLVSIQQQVPVSVTVSIPLDDGEVQTVTVPMALDLNLEIALSSTMSPVVSVAASEPTVTVAEVTAASEQVDDLGMPFVVQVADPEQVRVVEWTAFANLDGNLVFAGAIENVGDEQFSLVDVVVRFYAEDGQLVEIVDGGMSGQWVEPGQRSRFRIDTYLPADGGFERYAVDVSAVD